MAQVDLKKYKKTELLKRKSRKIDEEKNIKNNKLNRGISKEKKW